MQIVDKDSKNVKDLYGYLAIKSWMMKITYFSIHWFILKVVVFKSLLSIIFTSNFKCQIKYNSKYTFTFSRIKSIIVPGVVKYKIFSRVEFIFDAFIYVKYIILYHCSHKVI